MSATTLVECNFLNIGSASLPGAPQYNWGLEMIMGNYNDLSLYLVVGGDVTAASADTEWDGTNSLLVAATSEEGALKVAQAYDKGLVQADNLAWLGATIAVVTLRDSDTGLYV